MHGRAHAHGRARGSGAPSLQRRLGALLALLAATTAAKGVAASDTLAMIRVGAFNIQVFGQSKMREPRVPEILANITRHFDLLLVQEIRCVA